MNTDFIEKQMLGCFLKDNTLLNETNLKAHQFRNVAYRNMFTTMVQLANQNKAVDQVTLMTESYNTLNELGGIDYITTLKATGDVDHVESYERIMIEGYKKRAVAEQAQIYLASESKEISSFITSIQRIEEDGIQDEDPIQDIFVKLIEEPYQPETKALTGVPSGIKDLDVLTGGFQQKTSVIIGARPSIGKTAVMLKLALSAAENGVVPIIFSLEMAKESLLRRMIASTANINAFLARTPSRLTANQKQTWYNTVGKLSEMALEIFDTPMQTIPTIQARIRKVKREYPDKDVIVFIDYLTLIHNPGHFQSDHAKVSDTSARLKAMAKAYDCPVITLAQLSRNVEQRSDKHPMMSDLRESGSIEQDADLILLLYRASYYQEVDEQQDPILEIDIAKHREGPTGGIEVYYNRATGEIRELSGA